jgi:Flp pilus assembly protein TadG
MTMFATAKRLWRNEEGVAAVEFAIYSTAFFAMLFGGIYASILGFTSASMHEAVEAAARCSALGITCTDATSTQTYAASAFHNLTPATPSFTATDATCGKQVSGTLTYDLKWILSSKSITISATSCFPLQAASTS